MNIQTLSVHAGEAPDPATGAVSPNLVQATTFAFASAQEAAEAFADENRHHIYTRWSNPTVRVFEAKVAALEGAQDALAAASGMAAIATALLARAKAGDHLVCTRAVYGGTAVLLRESFRDLGIETTFVDGTRLEAWQEAIRPNTVAFYLESPGNPNLSLNDIRALAALARRRGISSFIDNTWATPYNQRPIELGVDVVVHSATKYFCGHGDAVGGVIAGPAEFIERARRHVLRHFGGVMAPFTAWLMARGLVTFALRMEAHNRNALRVAQFLEGHPAVERVHYPGLDSHPQYAVAREQMSGGFGGMVAFELSGGLEAGRRLQDEVQLCTLAVSLGDARTLITHPASTTHYSMPRQQRLAAGISDGLVRLSVGIEAAEDIIADLDQALAR